MNSDLAKKLNTFNNCKGTLEKMRYLQKFPKYLELPVRLPENSDETWFYIKPLAYKYLKFIKWCCRSMPCITLLKFFWFKKKKKSNRHLSQMQHAPFYITSLEYSHFISSISSVRIFLKFLTSQTYFSYYGPHDLWVPIAVETAMRLAM